MTTPSSALLPDLQKLVLRLLEDLKERAVENKDVDTRLRSVFALHQKQNRTAQAYEMWRTDELEQVAVAWVLGCVFIRFLEDNDLLGKTFLAGEGSRQEDADAFHSTYFRQNPVQSDRDFFYHVFGEMKKILALTDLFSENRTPLWLVGPSGDGASALRQFWMEKDPNTGNLKRSFVSPDWDTRFLGDLYQELSAHVREKYALLQTPDFVESFILDHTLDPAVKDFGLENVRMIDPTCGSGHFLLGAFRRLLDRWLKQEPGQNITQLVKHTLAAIHGVDINPYAVAIARFRLTLAALRACEISQLKNAPYFELNLAAGDSLMFGNRRTYDGRTFGPEFALFDDSAVLQNLFVAEDRKEAHAILSKEFHAVVGNPPYITVKDKALNKEYRNRYATCHMKYSLGVPFTERFVELAVKSQSRQPAGYVGMITTNSFMKREFGKKLIEEFFSKVELSHVIDTSGAYIPGHGTPTVVMFIQNRLPVSPEIRAALGIRGEPTTPAEPSEGLVWRSIVENIDCDEFENEFVSIKRIQRGMFSKHPWSIGGGGAAELKELLEEQAESKLDDHVTCIGFGLVLGEDDAFAYIPNTHKREMHDSTFNTRPLVEGEQVRDWSIGTTKEILFPYNENIDLVPDCGIQMALWPLRALLESRRDFSKRTYKECGRPFFEFHQIPAERNRLPLSITYAEIASHNHFVLDRGGKVFNRTAPVIKLAAHATEDDHLALLGLLNSSTACFWMKQVAFPKGGDQVGTEGARVRKNWWEERFQLSGTTLLEFPCASLRPLDIAKKIELVSQSIGKSIAELRFHIGELNAAQVGDLERSYDSQCSEMMFLQEELDWFCYFAYGLCKINLCYNDPNLKMIASHERACMIKMAKEIHTQPGFQTWFERHKLTPRSEIPQHWPASYREIVSERLNEINNNPAIRTIEHPDYKRRWQLSSWNEIVLEVAKSSILNELEDRTLWNGETRSISSLAEAISVKPRFQNAARILTRRDDFDAIQLVKSLAEEESVPVVPSLRFKDSGIEKHQVWKQVWTLQRREDAGETGLKIPVPPKYSPADFQTPSYWRLRGKLDVPKERFVSFPGSERAGDSSIAFGASV